MTVSTKRIVLYDAEKRPVPAVLQVEEIYSKPTLDGVPAKVIHQSAVCQLEDGTVLRHIDENTFESEDGTLLYQKPPSRK